MHTYTNVDTVEKVLAGTTTEAQWWSARHHVWILCRVWNVEDRKEKRKAD